MGRRVALERRQHLFPLMALSLASAASSEERLVAELIELMAQGLAPWRRPWREDSGQHVNLCTGHAYRGSNPVLLSLGMHLRGSALPYWCGWGEARRLGVAPRRGSRGVMILRPMPVPPPTSAAADHAPGVDAAPDPAAGEPSGRRGGIRTRPVVVFNAADLVGDGEGSRALAERIQRCRAASHQRQRPVPERLRRATAVLEAWPVPRLEGGNRACYRSDLDRIELPDADRFQSASARLATWAHEAIHSSGHPSRLNRNLEGAFGSAAYAREELVAELGAVLLGERLEIGSDTANHAAYLGHWCELLRQEPRVLLQVLGDARKAADQIAPEAALPPAAPAQTADCQAPGFQAPTVPVAAAEPMLAVTGS
jgi:antirestriction protein ArdC